jgi:hypothetical protein
VREKGCAVVGVVAACCGAFCSGGYFFVRRRPAMACCCSILIFAPEAYQAHVECKISAHMLAVLVWSSDSVTRSTSQRCSMFKPYLFIVSLLVRMTRRTAMSNMIYPNGARVYHIESSRCSNSNWICLWLSSDYRSSTGFQHLICVAFLGSTAHPRRG